MEDFAGRLTKKLGKPVKVTKNSEECLKGADIMVEATRLMEPTPLLKTEWVQPGNFCGTLRNCQCCGAVSHRRDGQDRGG